MTKLPSTSAWPNGMTRSGCSKFGWNMTTASGAGFPSTKILPRTGYTVLRPLPHAGSTIIRTARASATAARPGQLGGRDMGDPSAGPSRGSLVRDDFTLLLRDHEGDDL